MAIIRHDKAAKERGGVRDEDEGEAAHKRRLEGVSVSGCGLASCTHALHTRSVRQKQTEAASARHWCVVSSTC